jgi:hypothetical protein
MFCAKLIKRGIATDFEIFVEDDTAVFQPVDAAHDNGLFEFEPRNAISQQAARTVMAIIDMHFITSDAHIFGGGEPRRPRTDHADRLPTRRAGHNRFDPAFFPRRIRNELFDRTDRDRAVARKFDDTITFAQAILRADAAADFGHR